jgi:hypothetical protein
MRQLKTCLFLLSAISVLSCSEQVKPKAKDQYEPVREGVLSLMNKISGGIKSKGPIAWLDYLEYSPDFFMASEGHLQFPNIDSADNFIRNRLSKQIRKSSLNWNEIRVDPMNDNQAGIAAQWYEVFTDTAGVETIQRGYFTGIADKVKKDWLLRNLHWSVVK